MYCTDANQAQWRVQALRECMFFGFTFNINQHYNEQNINCVSVHSKLKNKILKQSAHALGVRFLLDTSGDFGVFLQRQAYFTAATCWRSIRHMLPSLLEFNPKLLWTKYESSVLETLDFTESFIWDFKCRGKLTANPQVWQIFLLQCTRCILIV